MFNFTDFTALLASLSLAPAFERPDVVAAGPRDTQNNLVQTASKAACTVEPYPSVPVARPVFEPFDAKIADIYRYRRQQSVNLGSWFVQENWMVPSLFTCANGNRAGEHDVASGWGNTGAARQVLERHWDTWIQDSDFAYLRSIGINTVRLPIGYWSLGPSFCAETPFEDVSDVYADSWPRVLRAIKTAEKYGIGVLVDLHGAPGSQNGQAHSGTSDGKIGLFDSPAYMNKTIDVLTFLTQQLTCVNNVVGIQLLNEPRNVNILPSFYNRTLTALRAISDQAATFPFYIHDAFNLAQYENFAAQRSDFLVEDHHSYFVFTPSDQAESAHGHTHDVNTTILSSLANTANLERGNLVVAEWSCALTDKSLSQESDPKAAQLAFCTEQKDVYASSSAGWAFWSYYMEDCPNNGGWCFKEAVNKSLPASFFSYPAITSAPHNPLNPVGDDLAQVLANLTADAGIAQIVQLALTDDGGDCGAGNLTSNMTDISSHNNTLQKRSEKRSRGLGMGYRRHQAAINNRRLAQRHKFLNATSSPSSNYSDVPSSVNATEFDRISLGRFANMNANQVAITRGYQDGFTSAKIFAQYGMSRVGFTGQYITDSTTRLVKSQVIQNNERNSYKTWFLKGLSDGEAQITAAITHTPPLYSHSR